MDCNDHEIKVFKHRELDKELEEARRPLVGLFTKPDPPPRVVIPTRRYTGVPVKIETIVNKCIRELEKKGVTDSGAGEIKDIVVAMVCQKHGIKHELIYGVFVSKKQSSKTVLTLATAIDGKLIGWEDFAPHYFQSENDKHRMIELILENRFTGNQSDIIKLIEKTFSFLVESDGKMMVPPENYEKLLASYSLPHTVSRMVKRLRRDEYF